MAFRSRPQEALFDENPRQGGVFTISNSSTPDAERLAQGCSYQCSRLLASASVSGQKLLTFQGIYHVSRSTLEGWTNIQESTTFELFTTFSDDTLDVECFFQISKRPFPPFSAKFHPSVQNRSALQLIYQLILINRADVRSNLVLYNVLIFLTSFVIPALLGYTGSILTKASWLRKLVRTQRHPTPTGWDYVFQQPKSYWILFHLTSGKLIGGYYDHTGFVSSYPQPQEIYVSQFWRVSDDGKFLEKVDRTAGGIIKAEEWTFIELFEA